MDQRKRKRKPEGLNESRDDKKPKGDDWDRNTPHGSDEENDEDDIDENAPYELKGKSSKSEKVTSRECPYLDTVSRQALDFDFEKCCSISLSANNVYCCLVCGQYYQGKGPQTHAHTHALEKVHHIFMNLESGRVFSLPENYEVSDPSLDDIRAVLDPQFSHEQVDKFDASKKWTRGIDGSEFLPGTVGLNNLRRSDYLNASIQLLTRVVPLRNMLLRPNDKGKQSSPPEAELTKRLRQLMRKMHNWRGFKGHVSPHEFMQAVMSESGNKFGPEAEADPVLFLSWLVNRLHFHLGGRKKRPTKSILTQCFQGFMHITTLDENGESVATRETPFFMLSLNLPPRPLFKDQMDSNAIPQVSMHSLLCKYDNTTIEENLTSGRRRFLLKSLPPFLLVHFKRFSKNDFFTEKNTTIVTFPMQHLDLSHLLPPHHRSGHQHSGSEARYNLVASISHVGTPEDGSYKAFVLDKGENAWFEMDDLAVREILPQQVSLSEAYVQLYERIDSPLSSLSQ